ncbi:transposase [Loktanella sp. IMCC34160]|uniref:REP-associated tyrosine transposase n=1 Tax=Loktanella sp. IMCC34160 TaxID=2510646 RepID=UPI001A91DD31|nr:transposase [Loktanella sp. IMCC34160]
MLRQAGAMSCYCRLFVPGGTWFFTVRLADRQSDLLLREVGLLRDCVATAKARWPFDIDAAVILPDHLHMIWTLPEGDADFPKRWRLIKSTFSRHQPPPGLPRDSQLRKGEKGIWQRRFWEHLIRDASDLEAHRRLIHEARVRAGLVPRPDAWPYSSVHRDSRFGGAQPPIGPGFAGQGGSRPTLRAAVSRRA